MKIKNVSKTLFLALMAILMVGCSQQDTALSPGDDAVTLRSGATQISGVGVFSDGQCDDGAQGADFSLYLFEGDLIGCLYVFVESYDCRPSGVYFESGEEYFVGSYNGEEGTFWTTYNFEAKYEDCEGLTGQVFGRCQHPIQEGSGTGVFEGVSGRLDFKDDVDAGEFNYRGHLRYGN